MKLAFETTANASPLDVFSDSGTTTTARLAGLLQQAKAVGQRNESCMILDPLTPCVDVGTPLHCHRFQVVAGCSKQRFSLAENQEGQEMIRANQGHTITSVDEEQLLTRIESAEQCPSCVVHGTYHSCWPAIREQGLSRMSRTHVHMAKGLPRDDNVVSG